MKFPIQIILATALCAALAACGDKKDDAAAAKAAPAPAAAPVDPLSVTPDAETAKWVKIDTVNTTEFRETLRVPAQVFADETRVARIGSPVTGRISELNAILGQNVQRGQVLGTLSSTELSTAQAMFLKAYSSKQLAERAAERATQLFEADVIGAAELQRRETELLQADAELSTAHDQLKVLGMSEKGIEKLQNSRQVNSNSYVVASLSGTIIERRVTQGQVVQPADAIFTVADLSHVWIQAEIAEKQAELVRVGDTVKVQIPALSNRMIDGKLVFVSSTVNPETRTVTARTEVANPDRDIRPAMLAVMLIEDRAQQRAVVPVDAVVRENNRDHIFIRTGANQFKLVTVTLGNEVNNVRPVIEGLKAGDEIVAQGAFHLNNERKQNMQ
ncbi:MAG: efflux RND transporter periplasmic adaptor subunit [Burkholderiales bacterium]|nr:efflux RND transporter periplasmic adaptor subunit [Burkholderiales bacterium]